MIVEDEHDIREMLEKIFQQDGHDTTAVKDGDEFLDRVVKENPDLVTLDVMMPGPTTREILQTLKEKGMNTPIILLTVVNYSDQEIHNLMQYGMIVDYITKPFDIPILLATIKQYVTSNNSVLPEGGNT